MPKNKLAPQDKKILKLLGYESTQEDGAQFEHPNIREYTTFPQYVWKGDTLEDVLKNFTAGVQHATMASIMGEIQGQMSKQKYLTNNSAQ
jgi:hypothetical protein|tara:strand:- start:841 stop:1110 length:270 start_codon:yes stop_codon:yes gene_type:complete